MMTTYTSEYKQTGLWYVDIKNEKWVESIETAIDKLNELIAENKPLVTLVQEKAKLNIFKQHVDIYSKKTIIDDKFTVVSKNEEEVHRPDFVEGQIYIVLNTDYTKAYFGQTLTYRSHGNDKYAPYGFEKRHKSRVYEAIKSEREPTDTMSRAVKKYGADNFQVYLITGYDKLYLDFIETFFITYFDTTNPEKGYNILPGGKSYFKMGSKPSSNWKPNGDLISQVKNAKRLLIDIKKEYEYIWTHIDNIERIAISTEKAYKGLQLRIEFYGRDSSKKICKAINFAFHESNKIDVINRVKEIIVAILSQKKLIVSFKQEDLMDALNIPEDLYKKHAKFKHLKTKNSRKERRDYFSDTEEEFFIQDVDLCVSTYKKLPPKKGQAGKIELATDEATDEATDNTEPEDEQDYTD